MMRSATRILFLLLAAAVMTAAAPAEAQRGPAFSDNATFSLIHNGREVGRERFSIKNSGGTLESSAELQMNSQGGDTLTESSVLRLDFRLRPVYYERQKKSPQFGGLTVRFGPKESSLVVTTGEGGGEQIFYLPENFLVVLDTNFFHQYTFLLLQYAESAGGPQPFNAFIPQEALPGIVHLERVSGDGQGGLSRYRVVTDELEMEILANSSGAIQRIDVPAIGLEVVRQ